ncbi:MAG: hypothetical protein ACK50Q_01675, partial [Labrys sp. (in: a-proteobacteria)]
PSSTDGFLEPAKPADRDYAAVEQGSTLDGVLSLLRAAADVAVDAVTPSQAHAQAFSRPWPYGDIPTPNYGTRPSDCNSSNLFVRFNTSGRTPLKVNHFDLFTAMNVAWNGCVESRPAPYDTDDTAPGSIANTRFVPWLWPDEYNTDASFPAASDPRLVSKVYIPDSNIGTKETRVRNNYLNDRRTRASTGDNAVWMPWWVTANSATIGNPSISTGTNAPANGTNNAIWNLRRAWIWKYRDSTPVIAPLANTADRFYESGPNAGCPDPIVPLTNNRTTVDNAIQALRSSWGQGTNNAEGLAWAWRVLSPTAPFTEGLPYNTENNKKVIVLMTDGQNELTYQPSTVTPTVPQTPSLSDYSSVGYAYQNRLGSTSIPTITTTINSKVTTICNAAKSNGIIIYTVLFDPNNGALPASLETIFRNCATDSSKFFRASSQAELIAAFNNVASEISKLRLTQ